MTNDKEETLKFTEPSIFRITSNVAKKVMLIGDIARIVVDEKYQIEEGDNILVELGSPRDGKYLVKEILHFIEDGQELRLRFLGHRLN